jgi:hypothetical protein
MLSNLVSLITKTFYPTSAAVSKTTAVTPRSNNPFADNEKQNPFLSTSFGGDFYGKNKPVAGGYFAGYYNGQPNIVGRKLFIEI